MTNPDAAPRSDHERVAGHLLLTVERNGDHAEQLDATCSGMDAVYKAWAAGLPPDPDHVKLAEHLHRIILRGTELCRLLDTGLTEMSELYKTFAEGAEPGARESEYDIIAAREALAEHHKALREQRDLFIREWPRVSPDRHLRHMVEQIDEARDDFADAAAALVRQPDLHVDEWPRREPGAAAAGATG